MMKHFSAIGMSLLLLSGCAAKAPTLAPVEDAPSARLLAELDGRPGNEGFVIERLEERDSGGYQKEGDFWYLRVADSDGGPVVGLACATNTGWSQYTTDAGGFCRINVPEQGAVVIRLYDRYAPEADEWTEWSVMRKSGHEDAVLTLQWDGSRPADGIAARENRLVVTVVDRKGTPVGNVPVWWSHPSTPYYKGAACVMPAPPALTDTDGRLTFTDVPSSFRLLRVTTSPYALTPGGTGGGSREIFYFGGEKELLIELPAP